MASSSLGEPWCNLRNRHNIGGRERVASALGGAALIGYALARPSFLATLLAAGGALMLERGITGECAIYRRLGIGMGNRPQARNLDRDSTHPVLDAIERASDDSFPASDPPSWSQHSVGQPA